MIHELGPLATDVHEAFAVYKNYDGNAPDTDCLVVCATEALAKEVTSWLEQHDPKGAENEKELIDANGEEFEVCWPYCDGSEWCSFYAVSPTVARAQRIARTLQQALELLAE